MTWRPGRASAQTLTASILLFVSLDIALPAPKDSAQKGMAGCTAQQIAAPEGKACQAELDKDVIARRKDIHTLKCDSSGMRCCIQRSGGGWGECGPVLLAPKPAAASPPKVQAAPPPKAQPAAVACTALKPKAGVWSSGAVQYRTAEKKCSVTYRCQAPPADQLTEDEKKCATVVSNTKSIVEQGVCAAKKDPCTACMHSAPSDPCTITFVKK